MSNKDYGFGGVFCIDMKTEGRACRLMDTLQNSTKFGFMGVSLGYYETLMTCSSRSTNSMMDSKEKESAGISPGLVRFSVGYVGTFEQKWSQFTKAYSEM
jgi:methionine-gamma-lyase